MTSGNKERASAEVTARVGNLGLYLGCFVGRLMDVNGARMSSVAVQTCPASALTLPAMIKISYRGHPPLLLQSSRSMRADWSGSPLSLTSSLFERETNVQQTIPN